MYCIAADSDADAATMIVYAIASCSSSLRTTLAMVDAFCPIATYTHVRSLPFWLMIVSIATAVLPVWRSPMISSRWPRPTGTIASIDFNPVCTGCDTGCRAITPGATFSMTSVILALTGPLPSIGSPSALTTRPMSSGPTGTSRMRPVHLTVSPSVICSYSPSTTAPTESRSRLRARPNVLPGNSSISPCIASDSPCTRQMPSVTDTTVPCVRSCVPVSRFSILDLMSSLISDGFNCMVASCRMRLLDSRARFYSIRRSGGQFVRHHGKLALYGAVDHAIADGDARAADQRRVDTHLRLDRLAEVTRERSVDRGKLRIGQCHRRLDRCARDVIGLVLARFEQLADLRQQRQAIGVDQHANEIAHAARESIARHRQEQRLLFGGGQARIVECLLHPRIGCRFRRHFQRGRPLRQRLRVLRDLECRLRV